MRLFPHFMVALVWIVFCLLHSLLAADSFKNKIKPGLGGAATYRVFYILFALLSFAAAVLYQLSVTSILLFSARPRGVTTGVMVPVGGLVVMGICIRRYFLQLSGLRPTRDNDTGNTLLADGINGYVRHLPLYMGTFLFIWSLWLLFPWLTLFISNMIITVYTIIGAYFEEKKLVKEFGQAYISYREKVPMFIPRFW